MEPRVGMTALVGAGGVFDGEDLPPYVDPALAAELEAALAKVMAAALERTLARLNETSAALVAAAGDDKRPTQAGLFDDTAWAEAVERDIRPALGRIVTDGANKGVEGITFDEADPDMVAAVERQVSAIAAWGPELKAHVSAVIERGISEGWSVADTAERLRSGNLALNESRARLIARTESVAASNAGAVTGWTAVAPPGSMKEWLSALDNRTRPSHRRADGQQVPLGEPFSVGGHKADFPGDWSLPVEERVNCRCSLLFVDPEEAEGSTQARYRQPGRMGQGEWGAWAEESLAGRSADENRAIDLFVGNADVQAGVRAYLDGGPLPNDVIPGWADDAPDFSYSLAAAVSRDTLPMAASVYATVPEPVTVDENGQWAPENYVVWGVGEPSLPTPDGMVTVRATLPPGTIATAGPSGSIITPPSRPIDLSQVGGVQPRPAAITERRGFAESPDFPHPSDAQPVNPFDPGRFDLYADVTQARLSTWPVTQATLQAEPPNSEASLIFDRDVFGQPPTTIISPVTVWTRLPIEVDRTADSWRTDRYLETWPDAELVPDSLNPGGILVAVQVPAGLRGALTPMGTLLFPRSSPMEPLRYRGEGAEAEAVVRLSAPPERATTSQPIAPKAMVLDDDSMAPWGARAEDIRLAATRPTLATVLSAAEAYTSAPGAAARDDARRAVLALVSQVYEVDLPDGHRSRITAAFPSIGTSGSVRITITGEVLDTDGVVVGDFSRIIRKRRDEPWEIHNDHLILNEAVHGRGIATEFNRQMEDWYIANGITEVRVHAALAVGGYAWARRGFDWDQSMGAPASALANAALEEIDEFARLPGDAVLAISGIFEDARKGSIPFTVEAIDQAIAEHPAVGETLSPAARLAVAQVASITARANILPSDDPDYPTPYEVSEIGHASLTDRDGNWPGQQALLGASWYGLKRLTPEASVEFTQEQAEAAKQRQRAVALPGSMVIGSGPSFRPVDLLPDPSLTGETPFSLAEIEGVRDLAPPWRGYVFTPAMSLRSAGMTVLHWEIVGPGPTSGLAYVVLRADGTIDAEASTVSLTTPLAGQEAGPAWTDLLRGLEADVKFALCRSVADAFGEPAPNRDRPDLPGPDDYRAAIESTGEPLADADVDVALAAGAQIRQGVDDRFASRMETIDGSMAPTGAVGTVYANINLSTFGIGPNVDRATLVGQRFANVGYVTGQIDPENLTTGAGLPRLAIEVPAGAQATYLPTEDALVVARGGSLEIVGYDAISNTITAVYVPPPPSEALLAPEAPPVPTTVNAQAVRTLSPDEIAQIQAQPGEPVVTGDAEVAVQALLDGRKVELLETHQASVLLDRLVAIVDEAKAKGEDAPVFDLCSVTIRGSSLFCVKSKGIPRIRMPQLAGTPLPGSRAATTPGLLDEDGQVNLNDLFRESLLARGIAVTDEDALAANLKASQNELNGGKVAGITRAMEAGEMGDERLFVSRDDYIVDGHHRWAAKVGVDARDNELGDITMPVARVDMDILTLLKEANDFAAEWGIPQAGVEVVAEGGAGALVTAPEPEAVVFDQVPVEVQTIEDYSPTRTGYPPTAPPDAATQTAIAAEAIARARTEGVFVPSPGNGDRFRQHIGQGGITLFTRNANDAIQGAYADNPARGVVPAVPGTVPLQEDVVIVLKGEVIDRSLVYVGPAHADEGILSVDPLPPAQADDRSVNGDALAMGAAPNLNVILPNTPEDYADPAYADFPFYTKDQIDRIIVNRDTVSDETIAMLLAEGYTVVGFDEVTPAAPNVEVLDPEVSIARATALPSMHRIHQALRRNEDPEALVKQVFDQQIGDYQTVTDTVTMSEDGFEVLGTVTLNGFEVGQFNRIVQWDPVAKERVVKHEFLSLNPGVRSAGFATEFNRRNEDWYAANGIKRIDVLTAMVGNYTWAQAGFDWVVTEGGMARTSGGSSRSMQAFVNERVKAMTLYLPEDRFPISAMAAATVDTEIGDLGRAVPGGFRPGDRVLAEQYLDLLRRASLDYDDDDFPSPKDLADFGREWARSEDYGLDAIGDADFREMFQRQAEQIGYEISHPGQAALLFGTSWYGTRPVVPRFAEPITVNALAVSPYATLPDGDVLPPGALMAVDPLTGAPTAQEIRDLTIVAKEVASPEGGVEGATTEADRIFIRQAGGPMATALSASTGLDVKETGGAISTGGGWRLVFTVPSEGDRGASRLVVTQAGQGGISVALGAPPASAADRDALLAALNRWAADSGAGAVRLNWETTHAAPTIQGLRDLVDAAPGTTWPPNESPKGTVAGPASVALAKTIAIVSGADPELLANHVRTGEGLAAVRDYDEAQGTDPHSAESWTAVAIALRAMHETGGTTASMLYQVVDRLPVADRAKVLAASHDPGTLQVPVREHLRSLAEQTVQAVDVWGPRGTNIVRAAALPRLEAALADANSQDIGWTQAEQDAFINEVIGSAIPAEMAGDFQITGSVSKENGGLKIEVEGVNAQGRVVLSMERHVTPEFAYHDEITIDPTFRGRGVGSQILRNMEDWYIANGVPRISLFADLDVGGYAWAQASFDWSTSADALAVLSHTAIGLKSAVDYDPDDKAEISRWLDQIGSLPLRGAGVAPPPSISDYPALVEFAALAEAIATLPIEHPDFPMPRDFAEIGRISDLRDLGKDVHPRYTWPGRLIMSTAKWDAVKFLTPQHEERRSTDTGRPPYRDAGLDDPRVHWDETLDAPQVIDPDPAVQATVNDVLVKIHGFEPEVTESLEAIAVANGGLLAGKDFRFKAPGGILDKIDRKVTDSKGTKTRAQVAEGIGDAIRYTIVLPTEGHGAAIRQTIEAMQAAGYRISEDDLENNWIAGDAYNGINGSFVHEASGISVELQFHTPESIEVKDRIHHDYEVWRDHDQAEAARIAAYQRMTLISDDIPFPDVEGMGIARHQPWPPKKEIEPSATGAPRVAYEMDRPPDGSPGPVETAANKLFETVHAVEPRTTDAFKAIAASLGGTIEGVAGIPTLDFRFKKPLSVLEKAERYVADGKADTVLGGLNQIGDALRYTFVFEPDSYTDSVAEVVQALSDAGYDLAENLQNHWFPGDAYNGINVAVRDRATGLLMEVQFHTPDSLVVKEAVHEDYEIYRSPLTTVEEKVAAFRRMRAITDAMPFPPGVQRLGDHVYRPDEEVDYRENGWRRVQTWAAAQDKVIGTGWPAGLADVDPTMSVGTARYTGSGYSAVNPPLRGEVPMSAEAISWISQMDADMTPTTEPITVYRGVNLQKFLDIDSDVDINPEDLGPSLVGRVVDDPGFVSTSILPGTALQFPLSRSAPVLMELTIEPGTGARIGHETEWEIILQRGVEFVITEWDPSRRILKATVRPGFAPAMADASAAEALTVDAVQIPVVETDPAEVFAAQQAWAIAKDPRTEAYDYVPDRPDGVPANRPTGSSFDFYTASGHRVLNDWLRGVGPMPEKGHGQRPDVTGDQGVLTTTAQQAVEDIDAAMTPTTEPVNVFRGATLSDLGATDGAALVGQTRVDGGYLSTTWNPMAATWFVDPDLSTSDPSDVILDITVPPGIGSMLGTEGESELVLERGLTLSFDEWDPTKRILKATVVPAVAVPETAVALPLAPPVNWNPDGIGKRTDRGAKVTTGAGTEKVGLTLPTIKKRANDLAKEMASAFGVEPPTIVLYTDMAAYQEGLAAAAAEAGEPAPGDNLPDARAVGRTVHVAPWLTRNLGTVGPDGESEYPQAFRQIAHEVMHTISGNANELVEFNTGLQAIVEEGAAEALSVDWAVRNFDPAFIGSKWMETYAPGDRTVVGPEAVIRQSVYVERVAEVIAVAVHRVGWNRDAVRAEILRVFTGTTQDRLEFFGAVEGQETVRFADVHGDGRYEPRWDALMATAPPDLAPISFDPVVRENPTPDDIAFERWRSRSATLLAWLSATDTVNTVGPALSAEGLGTDSALVLDVTVESYGMTFDPEGQWDPDISRAKVHDDWASIPIESVSPRDLIASEWLLASRPINEVVNGGEPLRPGYVVKVLRKPDGRLYIVDGHHRVAMAIGLGQDIEVQILDQADIHAVYDGMPEEAFDAAARITGSRYNVTPTPLDHYPKVMSYAEQIAEKGLDWAKALPTNPALADAIALVENLPLGPASDRPLYRGIRMDVSSLQPGAILNLPITSASWEHRVAVDYATDFGDQNDDPNQVIFEIQPGASHIDMEGQTVDHEAVLGGRFEVVSITPEDTMSGGRDRVVLRQVGVTREVTVAPEEKVRPDKERAVAMSELLVEAWGVPARVLADADGPSSLRHTRFVDGRITVRLDPAEVTTVGGADNSLIATVNDAIVHEYAHALIDGLDEAGRSALLDPVGSWLSTNPEAIASDLSPYATAGPEEFVAEAFLAWNRGTRNQWTDHVARTLADAYGVMLAEGSAAGTNVLSKPFTTHYMAAPPASWTIDDVTVAASAEADERYSRPVERTMFTMYAQAQFYLEAGEPGAYNEILAKITEISDLPPDQRWEMSKAARQWVNERLADRITPRPVAVIDGLVQPGTGAGRATPLRPGEDIQPDWVQEVLVRNLRALQPRRLEPNKPVAPEDDLYGPTAYGPEGEIVRVNALVTVEAGAGRYTPLRDGERIQPDWIVEVLTRNLKAQAEDRLAEKRRGRTPTWDEVQQIRPVDPERVDALVTLERGAGKHVPLRDGEQIHPQWIYDVQIRNMPPVVAKTPEQAVKALIQGRRVELVDQRHAVAMLDVLAEKVEEMRERGEEVPVYDLCRVMMKGTSLFCVKNKGYARVEMPQLAGQAIPGTKADSLPRDFRGKVDGSAAFMEHLTEGGIKITEATMPAADMKPTQNELNAERVAFIVEKMTGPGPQLDRPFLVSRDGYILDGHHRWAAQVALDARKGNKAPEIQVQVVDMGIVDLMAEAHRWGTDYGIPQNVDVAKPIVNALVGPTASPFDFETVVDVDVPSALVLYDGLNEKVDSLYGDAVRDPVFNMQGLLPSQEAMTVLAYGDLLGNYPMVAQGIRAVASLEALGLQRDAFGPGVAGVSSPDKQFILLNPMSPGEIAVQHDKGWLSSDDPRQVVVHEFGHHVAYAATSVLLRGYEGRVTDDPIHGGYEQVAGPIGMGLFIDGLSDVVSKVVGEDVYISGTRSGVEDLNRCDAWLAKRLGRVPTDDETRKAIARGNEVMTEQVSQYAATMAAEAFAESFAMAYLDPENASEVALAIKDWADTLVAPIRYPSPKDQRAVADWSDLPTPVGSQAVAIDALRSPTVEAKVDAAIVNPATLSPDISAAIQAIDSSMQPIANPFTLYATVPVPEVLPEVGSRFALPGYIHSSTLPEKVRPGEDGWLVEVQVPQGTYLVKGDHRPDGGVDGTFEAIVARGTSFEVTGVDPETKTITISAVSPDAPARAVERARALLVPTTAGSGAAPVSLPEVGSPTSMSGLSLDYSERIMAKMEEIGTTVPDMAARIIYLIDQARTVAPQVVAEGLSWYEKARAVGLSAAAGAGLDPEQGIGIVAAISPRLVWESNAPWAERIARAIAEDPEIDLTAEEHDRIRIDMPVGPTPLSAMTPEQAAFAILALAKREGMRIPVPTRQAELSLVSTPLPKELAKAVRIARGEPVNEVLSGHKVRSFFNNMMDPGNTAGGASVTIDTHAVSAALGVAIPSASPAMKILETPSSVPDAAKGIYAAVADSYRIAAERTGLTPEQAQAVAWLMWREVTDGQLAKDYCVPHLPKTGTVADLRDARRTLDGPGLPALVASGSWHPVPRANPDGTVG